MDNPVLGRGYCAFCLKTNDECTCVSDTMNANFVHIEQPDRVITIGYKNGRVRSVNWGTQFIGDTEEQIIQNVIDKLQLAIEFMKSKQI